MCCDHSRRDNCIKVLGELLLGNELRRRFSFRLLLLLLLLAFLPTVIAAPGSTVSASRLGTTAAAAPIVGDDGVGIRGVAGGVSVRGDSKLLTQSSKVWRSYGSDDVVK